MDPASPPDTSLLRLIPFREQDADVIHGWVTTVHELRRLAPNTEMPLTAEKMLAWQRPGGQAFVLVRENDTAPLGYAELNPMHQEREHLWLGHAIVHPDLRGRGLGLTLVRALVSYAFDHMHARRLSLIVFPENTAAVTCYRRAGFNPVSEEYHEFGGTRYRFQRFEIRR